MAGLIAHFDLETLQLDATNAFVNSPLQHDADDVYITLPNGYGDGSVFQLKRALYGL